MNDALKLNFLEKRDLEFIRRLRNENRQHFLDSNYISEQDQQRWYKSYLLKNDDQMFVLENNGISVGCGALYNIDINKKKAEVGRFVIDKSHRGKGYGGILIRLIEEMALSKFEIKELYLEVLAANIPAILLYKRMGYKEVGRQSGSVFKMVKRNLVADIIQSKYA